MKNKSKTFIFFFAVSFSIALSSTVLSGCFEFAGNAEFAHTNSMREALNDKGVMNIDPTNPYLAANKLLTSERNLSESLSGFLSIRGEPNALEINKDKSQRFVLKLYYTDKFERYELTAVDSANNKKDWVIAGPFPDQSVSRSLYNTANTPAPKTAKENPPVKYWPTPTPASFEPTIEVISSAAETTPRGDLVHYVTLPGETISIIARWYTGERDNAAKIARLNRMKNADSLQIGDSIIIPSYLVKNKNRLSEEGLNQIKQQIGIAQ